MIKVLVADDHAVVRSGLEQLLSTASDIEVVGLVADGEQAVELAARERPDVILMDLLMAFVDRNEGKKGIVADGPGAPVVVLAAFSENRRINGPVGAGG